MTKAPGAGHAALEMLPSIRPGAPSREGPMGGGLPSCCSPCRAPCRKRAASPRGWPCPPSWGRKAGGTAGTVGTAPAGRAGGTPRRTCSGSGHRPERRRGECLPGRGCIGGRSALFLNPTDGTAALWLKDEPGSPLAVGFWARHVSRMPGERWPWLPGPELPAALRPASAAAAGGTGLSHVVTARQVLWGPSTRTALRSETANSAERGNHRAPQA